MTGIIDDDRGMARIAKKIPLEEIFGGSVQDRDISIRPITQRNFSVRTYLRNAEKVAFNQARKFAKRIGSKIIHYVSWSGANPDFMNGDDRVTPHYYDITAVFY